MSSQSVTSSDWAALPLTFLQIFRSVGKEHTPLAEYRASPWHEARGQDAVLRAAGRMLFPFYYHFATSVYGIFEGDRLVAWLSLRGWSQALHIQAMFLHPGLQQHDAKASLLLFAEDQARLLKHQWLAATVPLKELSEAHPYEDYGFRRGHWRILRSKGKMQEWPESSNAIRLRPLFGPAARRAYCHFTELDLASGEEGDFASWTAFLFNVLHQRPKGKHWLILKEGQPVGYLCQCGKGSHPHFYLASGPGWWGDPLIAGVFALVCKTPLENLTGIEVRFASSGHHEVAQSLLEPLGFAEHPAASICMFKHLTS